MNMGFKDLQLNNLIIESIFQDLSNNIIRIYKDMLVDMKNDSIKLRNNEDEIRNYIVLNYLRNDYYRKKYNLCNYLFETGSEEINKNANNKKYGLLDIKIIVKELTFAHPNKYFIIECKRLDGSSRLNKEYITNGVRRFVSKNDYYYSTSLNRNYMMAFIVKDVDKVDLINEINRLQNQTKDLDIKQDIYSVNKEKTLHRGVYIKDKVEVILDHIFLDFSKVIKS